MTWKSYEPTGSPRASIVTFKSPRGRWRTGVWVRGGDEAALAEFVATSNYFQPVRSKLFDPDQGMI